MLRKGLRNLRSRKTIGRFVSTADAVDLKTLRKTNVSAFADLAEVKQREKFLAQLEIGVPSSDVEVTKFRNSQLTPEGLKLAITSGFATFLLHVEARIASSLGHGFYTIGPCGEEVLSAVALNLRAEDPSALHYRHVGTAILRQLRQGRTIEQVILDRARGFTVSKLDPVTGGRHCAIGGSELDYIVTSTLASQCTPAVGRALGATLMRLLKVDSRFPYSAISYVSVGDGSINNAHFLSAINLAEYATYHRRKCPVVFAISDNGISISLKDSGWLDQHANQWNMEKFICDGSSIVDVHDKSKRAIDYARLRGKPALLVFKNLSRRFGHASTDRQAAYLSQEEIQAAAETNHLLDVCALAAASGVSSWEKMAAEYRQIWAATEEAFDIAANEPKITSREEMVSSVSAPLAPMTPVTPMPVQVDTTATASAAAAGVAGIAGAGVKRREHMRKLMTEVFDEALGGKTAAGNRVVYTGEDVRHGGYYLVTDGLSSKYPFRVHDFPPDETSLLGASWGYAQAGLTPVVEIPYAKYLDCGADMFHEIIITHWLSCGRERPGLLIRLQGFDKGKFGGNFHTHNTIELMSPGLDVVCYSNGVDYVRGMRYLMRQASAGRVCMSVDSTELLNRRHLWPERKDGFFLQQYPELTGNPCSDEMDFETIVLYKPDVSSESSYNNKTGCVRVEGADRGTLDLSQVKVVIVSYGNGLPTSLIAMNNLINQTKQLRPEQVLVVDCPYLTEPPKQLRDLLADLKEVHRHKSSNGSGSDGEGAEVAEGIDGPHLVFADVCKRGAGMPLGAFAVQLQSECLLPRSWVAVGAQPTYNPLGQMLTFLSEDDVEGAVLQLLQRKCEDVYSMY